MDLMQLEMFVATAELRSVQRASERVFRTQPAVSMAIRKLEEELGTPLFDRANRGNYQLTAAGEVLFAYAQRLLGLRDEALTHVKELQSLEDGRVRIGANESTGNHLLPRLIQAFRKKYPKIRLDVTRQNSRQLIHDLRDNMVDLALISFAPDEKDIETTPIMKDALVLIGSPEHPLANKGRASLRELGSESFIAHTVTSQSRQKVVEAFRSSETPLRIVMEVAMLETIKELVAMKLGLAFVPEMSVQDEIQRGELVRIEVDGFQYERTLYLARRRSQAHSHAAREFAETVFATLKKVSD